MPDTANLKRKKSKGIVHYACSRGNDDLSKLIDDTGYAKADGYLYPFCSTNDVEVNQMTRYIRYTTCVKCLKGINAEIQRAIKSGFDIELR